MAEVGPFSNNYFLPSQCVSAPGGAEAVVHSWRSLLMEFEGNADFAGMKIDFVNAFNEVQRSVFLKECHDKFPQIFKWVNFCYSQHSLLFFGSHIISSQSGVQQGDPLGPFLFCLVLQILITKINKELPSLSLNSWYMDDGSLFGNICDVLKAWDIIKLSGPELGLFVNAPKCELILPSGNLDCFTIEADIKRIQGCNMDILESPVGSKAHCEDWVAQKLLRKVPALFDGFNSLDHLQSSFLLLLFCASFCKIVWYIQTVPPDSISDACHKFDVLVIQELEFLIGCGLPSHSVLQAQLSTKLGGLGLRASKQHSAAAYVSSIFSSKELIDRFLNKDSLILNSHIPDSFAAFNSLVHSDSKLTPGMTPTDQRMLSLAIDKQSLNSTLADLNVLDKARLMSCSMPHANSWIRALPIANNKLSNLEWSIIAKRWLGIAIFEDDHLCSACGKQVMDVFGHHAVVCDCSGDRIKRHNAIRDCLFDSCVAACWAPVKETPFLLAGSSERPADIFIPNFSHGKGLVIDTAVTCPLQRTSLHDSSRVAGFSCNKYADEVKSKPFRARVESEGFDYLPFVVESFGGFSEGAIPFLNKMTSSISTRFSVEKAVCSKSLYDKLSICLMKHVARSISSRFPENF